MSVLLKDYQYSGDLNNELLLVWYSDGQYSNGIQIPDQWAIRQLLTIQMVQYSDLHCTCKLKLCNEFSHYFVF